jgi:16S rRNA (uracil1498-N3)-methyltransferase
MPDYDFRTARLYVDAPLAPGRTVALDRAQAHYLTNVLRLKSGGALLVFNGCDGEWRATLAGGKRELGLREVGLREVGLRIGERSRAQTAPGDLHYLFAPLKSARLDYMVQKAVEMGVSHLRPVLTRHGQIARVNLARMRANAIEAAEQCGVLVLPQIAEPVTLLAALDGWDGARHLVFCDEAAEVADPLTALAVVPRGAPLAVLIGPEGGFAAEERAALLKLPKVVRLALGPRILRADTAAVAALALVQAAIGDWR